MPTNIASPGILYGSMSAGTGSRGKVIYAAQIDVGDPVSLQSQAFTMLSMDQGGRIRVVLSNSSAGLPQIIQVVPSQTGDGVGIGARAVAPAAGAAIATILAANLPAGSYEFQVTTHYDGAVAAAEINNVEFREGATPVTTLLAPSIANVVQPVRTIRRAMDGATAVSINAIAAGTAAVGYNAQIIAKRIA